MFKEQLNSDVALKKRAFVLKSLSGLKRDSNYHHP